jgi:hypothetical protein
LKAFEILKVRMIAFKSTSKNADNKEEIWYKMQYII